MKPLLITILATLAPMPEAAARPTDELETVAEIYARRAPAVFLVQTPDGHGTGFLIDVDGHVVTNDHVVSNASYDEEGYQVVDLLHGYLDPDGAMVMADEATRARVVQRDADRDLALLHIEGEPGWLCDVDPIPLRTRAPRPGEDVIMIGHPAGGLVWSLRVGEVSGVGSIPHDLAEMSTPRAAAGGRDDRRTLERLSVRILQSSCGANPGDSGGPLLDREGRLVAVTFSIPSDVRHDKFTYHVHLEEVLAFLANRTRSAGPPVPSPWRRRSQVQTYQTDRRAGTDVLLAGDGAVDTVLIDVDGAGLPSPDPDQALLAMLERSFEAEVILLSDTSARSAFYDTDGDGAFDLVLLDHDPDPAADLRWRRVDGHWTFDGEVDQPWFDLGLLEHLARTQPRLLERKRAGLRKLMGKVLG